MARLNPDVDYDNEILQLRRTYVAAAPQSRWNVISQRLAHPEIGPVRLLTVVSAVEALARSLLVNIERQGDTDTSQVYERHKRKEAHVLIKLLLTAADLPAPSVHFAEDTWILFRHAVNFRNLVIHECTFLGQDKYPSLIAASEEVLSELVRIGSIHVQTAA